MACEIYILSCPIGAIGDECTFEIDCCGGQTVNYTMQPDSIIEACVDDQGTVTVTSLSGSASVAFEECSSDCGDIPVVPTQTPTPTPTPTPTSTPTGCNEWELEGGSGGGTFSYTNCAGNPQTESVPDGDSIPVCALGVPTVISGNGNVTLNGPCASPTPTPTPTSTPAPTPTPTPINVQCFEWTLVCPSGSAACSYQYIDCDAVNQTGTLAPDQDIDVCVLFPQTPQINNGTAIETGDACSPGPTPTPGPPTPTPTPSTGCTEWTLVCPSGAVTCNYTYRDCDNILQSGTLYPDQDVDVCVKDNNTPTVQNGSAQNQNVACNPTITPTPTATPIPTPTPTPGAPTPTPTATPFPTPTPTTPPPTSVVPPIPSPVETEYTLTYSQTSKGWPSFYSYIPDYMLGMNQYFYTFNGGNLYQHNANGNRNNFYGEQYNSQITTVFNQNPLENKIFKTINLESDQAWQANLETDIQQNGFIESAWFKEKEGAYFAFLRQNGEVPALPGQYAMRSANGIGKSTSVSAIGNTTTINFSANPLVDIGSIVSVGDYLYFSLPSYTTISLGGQITNINVDIPAGINQILIDTSITGASTITIQDPYILYIKSSVAESHGLLGHYCIFTLINESTKSTELFAVESEVMKSYP